MSRRAQPEGKPIVVVRFLRFTVPSRHGHRVFEHARRLADTDRPEGLLHVAVGRQQDGPNDTFILVTEWQDLEALYRWVGRPELLSATPSLGVLAEFATDIDVQHYERPDIDAREVASSSADEGLASSASSARSSSASPEALGA
jgi:heme-degrading monooxygenase HmoA